MSDNKENKEEQKKIAPVFAINMSEDGNMEIYRNKELLKTGENIYNLLSMLEIEVTDIKHSLMISKLLRALSSMHKENKDNKIIKGGN